MSKHHSVMMSTAWLVGLIVSSPSAIAGLINGSFELPNVGLTGIAEIAPGSEPGGFGWKVDAGTVEVQGENYSNLPGPAFDGTQFLDLNGISVGTLSQTIDTSPGLSYQFRFAYANNYAHTSQASPALATVHVADVGSGTDLITPVSISHGTSTASNLDWTVLTLTFSATGDSTRLRFVSNTSNPLGGILLDGGSLTPLSTVPEPVSIVLLGVGFLTVGLVSEWRTGHRVHPSPPTGPHDLFPARKGDRS
jgi:hypothetical protein